MVRLVCNDLMSVGHKRIILKCDSEPAMKKITAEALVRLKVEVDDLESVSREYPERYESQSNSMTEVGRINVPGSFQDLQELP